MSSIAYITDRDMIEYHRLHGNREMIFWRPSAQKHFQHFQIGDYLFFLTKGTEKGRTKEKGIIGYGRLAKDEVLRATQAWQKYGTMCGYGNEKQFQTAATMMNKAHILPKQIHCLYLERVLFFQAPIYLSEFAVQISKQIESYIYLNQEKQDLDLLLVEKAAQIGCDPWNSDKEQGDRQLMQDREVIKLQSLRRQLPQDMFTHYEKKKLRQLAQRELKDKNGSLLGYGKEDYILWENEQSEVYLPCDLSLQNWKRHLLILIAKAHLYQEALRQIQSSAMVRILFKGNDVDARRLCDAAGIAYLCSEKYQETTKTTRKR